MHRCFGVVLDTADVDSSRVGPRRTGGAFLEQSRLLAVYLEVDVLELLVLGCLDCQLDRSFLFEFGEHGRSEPLEMRVGDDDITLVEFDCLCHRVDLTVCARLAPERGDGEFPPDERDVVRAGVGEHRRRGGATPELLVTDCPVVVFRTVVVSCLEDEFVAGLGVRRTDSKVEFARAFTLGNVDTGGLTVPEIGEFDRQRNRLARAEPGRDAVVDQCPAGCLARQNEQVLLDVRE